MAYIAAADLRTATALYPYLTVPSTGNGSVSDARLTSMIAAATQAIDTYCRDHFEPTAATTIRLQGDSSRWLYLPKRIRAVTTVALVDPSGVSTTYDSTYWRMHTSFNNVSGANIVQGGFDAFEVKSSLSGTSSVGWPLNAEGWPPAPWHIEITGDWDWAVVPEAVKQAACLLVWSWCQMNTPPNVEGFSAGGVSIRRPPLAVESTGVFEADRLLAPLRRLAEQAWPTVV